jgi:hypothetical protein
LKLFRFRNIYRNFPFTYPFLSVHFLRFIS